MMFWPQYRPVSREEIQEALKTYAHNSLISLMPSGERYKIHISHTSRLMNTFSPYNRKTIK